MVWNIFRCYYIAEVYVSANKWVEAMALYGRAEEYITQASQNSALKDKVIIFCF